MSGPTPSLSHTERDRRHRVVAERMAAAKLDVLVLPASTARWEQTMADSRYLTGIGGFGTETLTVFSPQHGATAYVFNRAGYWKHAQDWTADVRDGRNKWGENVRERLGELGFSSGRIGLSGLGPLTRNPDGIVPHRMVETIARDFPAAEIVDATGLMNTVRAIKSAEEVAVMERSTAIAEAMAARVMGLKRGDTERTVYAAMIETLLLEGGELPAMLLLGSGPNIDHGSFVAGTRRLEAGDLVVGEIEGRYLGYSGQIVRPASLGHASQTYRDAFEIIVECFEDLLGALKAGASLADLVAFFGAAVARRGRGRYEASYPLMHARGLGDEVPVMISAEDLEGAARIRLEAGMVFVLKPRLKGEGVSVQVGDMVVVGESGARRLGRAPLQLAEVPWN